MKREGGEAGQRYVSEVTYTLRSHCGDKVVDKVVEEAGTIVDYIGCWGGGSLWLLCCIVLSVRSCSTHISAVPHVLRSDGEYPEVCGLRWYHTTKWAVDSKAEGGRHTAGEAPLPPRVGKMEDKAEAATEPTEKEPENQEGRRSKNGSPRQEGAKRPSSRIRVLYLQGFEGFSPKIDKHLLMDAVGADNVLIPDLHTKRTIIIFAFVILIVVLLMGGAVIAAFVTKNIISGLLALLGMIALGLICFVLGGRGVTHLVLKQAVTAAEKAFATFRPNVIVASAFGAVVCFQMDIPKLPLLLLAPAQDQYYRYMHLRPYISISDYPYVIVVHGSLDETVPLDDSIRLVETCEVGRCRLEVVDDNHQLACLSAADLRRWIDEAYEKGKQVVLKQSAAGSKSVDPTLFGDTENDVVH